jgi:hypothetical protein
MPINKLVVSAFIVLTIVFGFLTIVNLFSLHLLSAIIDGALTILFYYQAKTTRAQLGWPFYR